MGSQDKWQSVRAAIVEQARGVGFEMSSLVETGEFLATLAASKPGGRVLELGTGLGFGATWLLQGMSADSQLVTVENDPQLSRQAQANLGADSRAEFVVEDAGEFLAREARNGAGFDMIFADAWPGKFSHLEEALQLVRPGGFYVVDDLLPQSTWPDGHDAKVKSFVATVPTDRRFAWVLMQWASGVLLGTRL